MSFESLINYGVKSINDSEPCPLQNTLVVIGVARGGTSMMAGALRHLGVHMHKARQPVYEDIHIAAAFEEKTELELEKIIATCNNVDQWAWKRPKAITYLEKAEKHLRNPRFIFIFRDIFAIANRSGISMGSDVLPLMNDALEQYTRAVAFIDKTSAPCLICSSEKMTRYPREIIQSVATFSGLKPDEATLNAAIESIDPESGKYLKASRLNRTHGQIGVVNGDTIKGWAAWWSKDEPAEVEIYLNDKLHTVVCANESRPHLANNNRTRKGLCGFSLSFPENTLTDGVIVRAKIKSDVIDLEHSPWKYQPGKENDGEPT